MCSQPLVETKLGPSPSPNPNARPLLAAPIVVEQWAARLKDHPMLRVHMSAGLQDNVLPAFASDWCLQLLQTNGAHGTIHQDCIIPRLVTSTTVRASHNVRPRCGRHSDETPWRSRHRRPRCPQVDRQVHSHFDPELSLTEAFAPLRPDRREVASPRPTKGHEATRSRGHASLSAFGIWIGQSASRSAR